MDARIIIHCLGLLLLLLFPFKLYFVDSEQPWGLIVSGQGRLVCWMDSFNMLVSAACLVSGIGSSAQA
jgi:hypothetical protein